jgi:hypothetical protein
MDEKKVFLIFGGMFVLILVGILLFLFNPNLTGNVFLEEENIYVQEMIVNFTITDERIIGLNADTDALKFGTISLGGYSKRKFNITNPFDVPVRVEINFSEDIVELISIDRNHFILQPYDSSKKITAKIRTGNESEVKSYEGIMSIIMRPI